MIGEIIINAVLIF